MSAVRSEHVRRGYVAVCLAIGAVCASAALDYGKTIDTLNVDTQLPLERLAVGSDTAATLAPRASNDTVRDGASVRGIR